MKPSTGDGDPLVIGLASEEMQTPPQVARELFAPIAPSYERGARLLSLGQDDRWRRKMVSKLDLGEGSLVLDVAAGTGSITRLLEAGGCRVVPVDQSLEMLSSLRSRTLPPVVSTAEALPFGDGIFDGVTFGYLLRYVVDVVGCMAELARVLRPGGMMAMVEFGLPTGPWRPLWEMYTGGILPILGGAFGGGWRQVGGYLRPSIVDFSTRWDPERLRSVWVESGLEEVTVQTMSLGGGLVMWGRKR